jgi:hypothetical protein
MVFLLVPACQLFDPATYGAVTCDEYCGEVLDRVEVCAQEQAETDCLAAGGTQAECSQNISDQEMSAYASEGNASWDGKSRAQMVASCKDSVSVKSEAQCAAETATINNLSCDDLLGLIGGM